METNTPKQRARLLKVRQMLADGVSPYAEIGNKGQIGGSVIDRVEAVKRDLTETQVSDLERKWRGRSGTVKPSITFGPGPFMDSIGFGEPVVIDPDKVFCSFCQKQIDRITASHGIGKPRKIKTVSIVEDIHGVRSFDEKVSHSVDKLTACPRCIDLLPTLKFPETEG